MSNVIPLPAGNRHPRPPVAAVDTAPGNVDLRYVLADRYRDVIAQQVGKFDDIALGYLKLVEAFPESAERDQLVIDIAVARQVIDAALAKLRVRHSGDRSPSRAYAPLVHNIDPAR
jgi:hypothetical protein